MHLFSVDYCETGKPLSQNVICCGAAAGAKRKTLYRGPIRGPPARYLLYPIMMPPRSAPSLFIRTGPRRGICTLLLEALRNRPISPGLPSLEMGATSPYRANCSAPVVNLPVRNLVFPLITESRCRIILWKNMRKRKRRQLAPLRIPGCNASGRPT